MAGAVRVGRVSATKQSTCPQGRVMVLNRVLIVTLSGAAGSVEDRHHRQLIAMAQASRTDHRATFANRVPFGAVKVISTPTDASMASTGKNKRRRIELTRYGTSAPRPEL